MSELNVEHTDVASIVQFNSSRIISEVAIAHVGRELFELVDETNGQMLVDFSAVNFMSSAMLGKLMGLNERCKSKKVNLRMCGIAPSLMEAFKSTGLNKVFRIHQTREEALAAFKKKGWFR